MEMTIRDFILSDFILINIGKQFYLKLGDKKHWILKKVESIADVLMAQKSWELDSFWLSGVDAETLLDWLLLEKHYPCFATLYEAFQTSSETKVELMNDVDIELSEVNYGFFAVEVQQQDEKVLKVLAIDWEANAESNPDLYLLKQVIKYFSPDECEDLKEVDSDDYDLNDIKDIELLKLCILATYKKEKAE